MNNQGTGTAGAWDPLTDLLLRAQKGSEEAFGELVERMQKGLWLLANNQLHDTFAADEVVDVTFLRVWEGRDGFDPRLSKARTWITSIARNLIKDALRARLGRGAPKKEGKKRLKAEAASAQKFDHVEDDGEQPPEVEADRIHRATVLRRGLAKLAARSRRALEMMYFEGLDRGEIAAEMECSENAVSSLLSRARAELMEALGPDAMDLM